MSLSFNIDIDSSYRDRITYPDAGNFVVPMNPKQPSVSSGFNAKDPVLLGFPYDTGICYYATGPNTFSGITMTLSTGSSSNKNFYVGSIIEFYDSALVSYYAQIISYDNVTKVIQTITPFPGGFPLTPFYYTIRYELPQSLPPGSGIYTNSLPVNAPSVTEIQLGPEANNLSDTFFIGKYFYLQPPITTLPWAKFFTAFPPFNNPAILQFFVYQWSIITDFDPLTNIITLAQPMVIEPSAGSLYEILNFSYDNAQPLRYAGTDIFSNPRMSNISLINCMIPAYLPLVSLNSGFITDYPYVYIAFYSEKERTYNQPIISMSPLSDRALFKVPIAPDTDTNTTKFISLTTGITSQYVYFKHNDTFRFEIYLPNGQPIRFNPAFFQFFSGIYTFFTGLGFPVVPDPKANIQATFRVSF